MLEVNQVHCGDCLELMREIPDGSVDFAFADPPYGIGKAAWDNKYPEGFEQELLRIAKGCAITPGQENIGICINALGDSYKGLVSAWNINGMTFSKIGFENWIPVVMAGKFQRHQNCFRFIVKGDKPNHPSPKPIEFMMEVLIRYTNPGDLILDPFLGSGTTAVAAIRTGRRFIGIELDPGYCDIARKRIAAEQAQYRLAL
jgi:DNA modification methylase